MKASSGYALHEYALIAALGVVVAVPALGGLGGNISGLLSSAPKDLDKTAAILSPMPGNKSLAPAHGNALRATDETADGSPDRVMAEDHASGGLLAAEGDNIIIGDDPHRLPPFFPRHKKQKVHINPRNGEIDVLDIGDGGGSNTTSVEGHQNVATKPFNPGTLPKSVIDQLHNLHLHGRQLAATEAQWVATPPGRQRDDLRKQITHQYQTFTAQYSTTRTALADYGQHNMTANDAAWQEWLDNWDNQAAVVNGLTYHYFVPHTASNQTALIRPALDVSSVPPQSAANVTNRAARDINPAVDTTDTGL